MKNLQLFTNTFNNGNDLIKALMESNLEVATKTLNENANLIALLITNDSNAMESLVKAYNLNLCNNFFEPRFYEAKKATIQGLLDNELSFDNLFNEYNLYNEKIASAKVDTSKMTYEEIMNLEYNPDKILYDSDMSMFKKVLKASHNLYLWGNAGNGKTTFASNMAHEMGLHLTIVSSVKNEYSLKGYFDLNTNEYCLSNFEKWYRDGGLLLLDECDTYSQNAMLYLNNAIEINSKFISLENGENIEKNPNCYIIACANTNGSGKTSDYVGRVALDKAFLDRFTKIKFKEYAYIHQNIIKDSNAYNLIKGYYKENEEELTCRDCVKFKRLMNEFDIATIIEMLKNNTIEL